jgi:hypothetical protein
MYREFKCIVINFFGVYSIRQEELVDMTTPSMPDLE